MLNKKQIKTIVYHSYKQKGIYEVKFECDEESVNQIDQPKFIPTEEVKKHFVGEQEQTVNSQITPKKECKGCNKNKLARWASGGWGIFKSELGIDKTPDDIYEERKKICLNCPSNQYDFGECKKCECILPIKLTIKGESCPMDHWKAVE